MKPEAEHTRKTPDGTMRQSNSYFPIKWSTLLGMGSKHILGIMQIYIKSVELLYKYSIA